MGYSLITDLEKSLRQINKDERFFLFGVQLFLGKKEDISWETKKDTLRWLTEMLDMPDYSEQAKTKKELRRSLLALSTAWTIDPVKVFETIKGWTVLLEKEKQAASSPAQIVRPKNITERTKNNGKGNRKKRSCGPGSGKSGQ